MKTKLSPIEELRAQRMQLQQECEDQRLQLNNNISYLKGNFGSLLFSSVVTSSKNAVTSLFLGSTDASGERNNSFLNKALMFAPLVWDVVQPMLIGLATKKIKSLIFGRKKKKADKD